MELFENAAVLSLNIYQADFKKREPLQVQPRAFHSLTLRLSGTVRLWADGKELLSQAPCITYMPMGMPYGTEAVEDGQFIAIHFSMTPEADSLPPFVYVPEQPDRYVQRFSELLTAARPGHPRDYRCLSLFYRLLALLQSDLYAQQSISPRMLQARKLLEEGFSDPQFSIGAAAAALGISTVYLRREFKAAFGVTPIAYLQQVRMERARAMLQTGYYTVGEVAAKCGYESLSYFSAAFRRLTGSAPSIFSISSPFL